MTDLVALIVGIAHYPELPESWHVQGDRTAHDAIEVTRALVARGADPKKIKLLLSMKSGRPADVAGVVPDDAKKDVLEAFIRRELGKREPFVGSRFLLFCSGHGASAEKRTETLIITPDSYADGNERVFNCLGIEQLRVQLQGRPQLAEQIFCVNACRTPAEWAIPANEVEMVATLKLDRPGPIAQARFFAAGELEPAPVVETQTAYSNGFAAAVVNCIKSAEWPPRAGDWQLRLHKEWPETRSDGIHGPDRSLFTDLYGKLHVIDRERQHKLAQKALVRSRSWNERPDANSADLWRSTVIDLHACTADRLDLLITRLEQRLFTREVVADKIQRVEGGWPNRKLEWQKRRKNLIGELTYCLAWDRDLTEPSDIVDAVAGFGSHAVVVYLEIVGPCEEDRALIDEMLTFWRSLIAEAQNRGTSVPSLPLLIIGHVDPGPRPDTVPIDATLCYRKEALVDNDERRLNVVRGDHLRDWLNPIVSDQDLRRADLEREIARALGGRVLEDIVGVRMGQIIEAVDDRAAPR